MKKLNSPLVLAALLSAVSGQAVAELRVVVTPTKTEKPISEVNAQVEVITREEIEIIQPASTTELLASRAGVEIGRNGGEGQLTSIFMRGANSNHSLILIDGVNVAPDIGQAAIQNINPELIERIEIVKGARAAQYGSHAIGGVINIITRTAKDGLHGEFGIKAGRYETEESTAGLSYGSELFQAGFNAAQSSAGGLSAQATPIDEDEFENTSANAFFRLNLGDQASLGIKHFQADGNVEYDSFGSDGEQDFNNKVSSLDFDFKADSASIKATYSRAEDNITQKIANFLGDFDYTETTRDTFDAQASVHYAGNQTVTTGIELVEADLYAQSFGTNIEESNDRKSIFAQYELSADHHQVLVSGRHSDYNSFGIQSTGGLEYAYKIDGFTTLFAGVSNAFRAPSLTDRFGFGGNANLDPEKSITREFGLRLGEGKNSVKVTLFDTDIESLIVYTAGQNQNIDKAENTGIEVGYDYTSESVIAYFDVLVQSPEDKSDGSKLLRRSALSVKTGATYSTGKWGYNANVSHNGTREDVGGVSLKTYTLLNASISYQATSNLKLALSGKNMGNVEYQLANTYNQPKAAYYASAKMSF